MRTFIISALLSLFVCACFAQPIPPDSLYAAQIDCNCEQALNQLIQKIETEYPGFNDKTKDKIIYNNYKENLLIKACDIKEPDRIELLRRLGEGCNRIFRELKPTVIKLIMW